jgi:NAD(P)-dependent dehydrogenase (short-subunit alcohol dehydrogenase family)
MTAVAERAEMSAADAVQALPSQAGRTFLITGANSGIGLRSALVLAGRDARVLLACRNPDRGATALAQVRARATDAEPEFVRLDLADLASVRAAVASVADRVEGLDVLINNAGVMAVPSGRSADGYELHMATNHLGHFALTLGLLPVLLRASAPRVVTVASMAHRTGRMRWDDLHWQRGHYWPWLAYSQSKLANLLFMRELEARARGHSLPIVSVAAHPGAAKTDLAQHVRGPVRSRMYGLGLRCLAQSDVSGALPQLVAATDPMLPGGSYLGPKGRFGWIGGHAPARMSRAACDGNGARRLWAISEELTGTRFEEMLEAATPLTVGPDS